MIPFPSTSKNLIHCLGESVDYSSAETSFSPHYSDIGLGMDESSGIHCAFIHYNRKTSVLLTQFLTIPHAKLSQQCSATHIKQDYTGASLQIAFYQRNSWIVECDGIGKLQFSVRHASNFLDRQIEINDNVFLVRGYLPTGDRRDPDSHFPVILGLRVVKGNLVKNLDVEESVELIPDKNGKLLLAFSINILEVDQKLMIDQLNSASQIETAIHATEKWISTALGPYQFSAGSEHENRILSNAIFSLLSNSTKAPGLLSGRISAFPSRGKYPTHYLWDSCFQNLATELMEPQLAIDSLLILIENLRSDGKMPHFICSTWVRPHESQSPLVGWAGLRLVKERKDKVLAKILMPALQKNTDWWLTQRITRYGLISALHGVETGWDDSPRFDNGPTVACDLNSYLLIQMRAIADLAMILEDSSTMELYSKIANDFAQQMIDKLFDKSAGLFWDIDLKSGNYIKIKTPACFLPILAGVPISAADKKRAISEYLINPKIFFGDIPFPSVAYDEDCYQPEKWWRGPTWMPVAYLMLQTLNITGFYAEEQEARNKLYAMLIKDGELRELFNSLTGEGLGAYQQGWTAAICIRLNKEIQSKEKG